jgi:hypothetical protein
LKHSAKHAPLKKRHQSKPQAGNQQGYGFSLWGIAWTVLGMMVIAAGTVAVLEFFVWNKVPPALVGKWKIEDGPLAGGTFEFSRNGDMAVKDKNQKGVSQLKAKAVLEGKTIVTTSSNPLTREQLIHTSTVRELTATTLVIELESGDVLKMVR